MRALSSLANLGLVSFSASTTVAQLPHLDLPQSSNGLCVRRHTVSEYLRHISRPPDGDRNSTEGATVCVHGPLECLYQHFLSLFQSFSATRFGASLSFRPKITAQAATGSQERPPPPENVIILESPKEVPSPSLLK